MATSDRCKSVVDNEVCCNREEVDARGNCCKRRRSRARENSEGDLGESLWRSCALKAGDRQELVEIVWRSCALRRRWGAEA